MRDSIFEQWIKTPLVTQVNQQQWIDPAQIVHQGSLYVYQREQCTLAQKKLVLLTYDALFILNPRKSSVRPGTHFVNARVNICWSRLCFARADEQSGFEAPSATFRFQISFVLNGSVARFFLISEESFTAWRAVLRKTGIQTDFQSRYTLREKIGKGASASVYKLTDNDNDRALACKVFQISQLKSDQVNLRALANEIAILRDLRGQPNVVQIEEVFETADRVYLVTELIEGGKVFGRGCRYQSGEICRLIESVLATLVFLNKKGIIHRDIKPDNLLLKHKQQPIHENEIIIIDFGLATYLESSEMVYRYCGTIGYMAPEILATRDKEAKYTPAVDVFSFGVVLYNFITRTKAFRQSTAEKTFRLNRTGQVDLEHPKMKKITPSRELTSERPDLPDAGHRPRPADFRHRGSAPRLLHH